MAIFRVRRKAMYSLDVEADSKASAISQGEQVDIDHWDLEVRDEILVQELNHNV